MSGTTTKQSVLVLVSTLFLGLAGCSGDDGDDGRRRRATAPTVRMPSARAPSASTVTSGGRPGRRRHHQHGSCVSSRRTRMRPARRFFLTPYRSACTTCCSSSTGSNVEESEPLVGVAAGATSTVAFTVGGLPGAVTGTVLGPDGSDPDTDPDPVEGATVSTEGSAPVVTDEPTASSCSTAVVRGFLSVEPPAGTTLLAGGTSYSVGPGADVDIELSGGPESDATSCRATSACSATVAMTPALSRPGRTRATTAWSNALSSRWIRPAGRPTRAPSLQRMVRHGRRRQRRHGRLGVDPSHDVYIRTCNDDPDLRFEALVDGNDDGADEATTRPCRCTRPTADRARQRAKLAVLQDRGEAVDLHGAWKQRYMFSIGDLTAAHRLNPEGTFAKNAKPAFVAWDTTQTCEDMLLMPIQYNQRTDAWVSYHNGQLVHAGSDVLEEVLRLPRGGPHASRTSTATSPNTPRSTTGSAARNATDRAAATSPAAVIVNQIVNPRYLTATSRARTLRPVPQPRLGAPRRAGLPMAERRGRLRRQLRRRPPHAGLGCRRCAGGLLPAETGPVAERLLGEAPPAVQRLPEVVAYRQPVRHPDLPRLPLSAQRHGRPGPVRERGLPMATSSCSATTNRRSCPTWSA